MFAIAALSAVLLIACGEAEPSPSDGSSTAVTSTSTQPVATASIAEPTDTLTAEATPAPTEACPSPDQQAYIATLNDPFTATGEAFERLSTEFTAAGSDSSLFADERWVISVAVSLVTIQNAADQMRDASPPESLNAFHGDVVALGDTLEEMVGLLTEGLDQFDVDKINGAVELMLHSNDLIVDLTDNLDAICS